MRLQPQSCWLVLNEKSGSYSEEAATRLAECLAKAGFPVARTLMIPHEDLPTPADLDREDIGMLAIFTGDGTISRCVGRLKGWQGCLLVLPGGTMNLLSGRLHSDADAAQIIDRLTGDVRCADIPTICHKDSQALVGVSAGPGAQWYDVRETARDGEVGELLSETAGAIGATVEGPFAHCREPVLGRDTGYPLIELEPSEEGIRIVAYTAEDFAGYVQQGLAMIQRRFREGPHEILGHAEAVTLDSETDLALSIDGEPVQGEMQERFTVARSQVNLIATNP